VKLLRTLQEREVEPLGASAPIAIDVRFVAASNADIEELVAAGQFRRDLYFRVNVVTIQVPPLRTRPDDIEPAWADAQRGGRAGEGRVIVEGLQKVRVGQPARLAPADISGK